MIAHCAKHTCYQGQHQMVRRHAAPKRITATKLQLPPVIIMYVSHAYVRMKPELVEKQKPIYACIFIMFFSTVIWQLANRTSGVRLAQLHIFTTANRLL